MAKNRSEGKDSWKSKEPNDWQDNYGRGENQAKGGPARSFDGRCKWLHTGADFHSAIEFPDDVKPGSSPAPGGGEGLRTHNRPRRHLSPKKGNPGPM